MMKKELNKREFYDVRSLMGYFPLYMFAFLIGGRQAGKSYAITEAYVKQYIKYGTPFYWLRLTERQSKQLLQNNAEKLIDPDIRRKYNLDLTTNGTNVYHVIKRSAPDKHGKTKILEKKLIARVIALSTFYADKGNGYFDNEYEGWYNIALDEMQPEKGEKRTFDIMYSFVNQLENLLRNTKTKVRVIGICNLLEEASDILCAFNFLPEKFGRYSLIKNKKILTQYLKELEEARGDREKTKIVNKRYKDVDFGKRAIIEYIEPTEAYKEMRHGSIADILMPNASTFSNSQKVDNTLIFKGRLKSPNYIIKFSKNEDDWFTVWDSKVVKEYKKEKKTAIAMRPYIDEIYIVDTVNQIINRFDLRGFMFRDLITFKRFQKCINILKPRGN